MKPATQLSYGRRIARAMSHVADRPDRTPTLEELAAVAAFSPCHFHRIYRAVAGETPAETLARARLSRAAAELLRGASPVAQIARRAGYGSAAAFTRAFRAAHGVPPAAYRARGGIGLPVPAGDPPTEESAMFHVTLRDLPAMRLAAIRHTGPYHGIGAAFDRAQAWGAARGLIGPNTDFFGLYHDDPGSVPAERLRADTASPLAPRQRARARSASWRCPRPAWPCCASAGLTPSWSAPTAGSTASGCPAAARNRPTGRAWSGT
jgi:AraC family transcriptional regulator